MGIVLIGGLLSSLFLTLILVPTTYITTRRIAEWWEARRARRSEPRGPLDHPFAAPPIPAGAIGD